MDIFYQTLLREGKYLLDRYFSESNVRVFLVEHNDNVYYLELQDGLVTHYLELCY